MQSNEVIQLSYTLNTTPTKLWAALTDLDKMKEWYFENIPSFQPVVGFKTSFPVVSNGQTFTHQWEILSIVACSSMTHTWEYQEYEGKAIICFSIEETASKGIVELHIKMDIVESFPTNVIEFKTESCIAGWNYFISERLVSYLASC